jgi:peroxiredoxin
VSNLWLIFSHFPNFAIKNLKKLSALLSLVLFMVAFMAQAQIHISYTVKGLDNIMVTLSSVRGSVRTPIDSVISDRGLISFNNPNPLPAGVYRITFGKNLFTDIILNGETIVMENDIENMLDDLVVKESNENKIYYDYWRTSMYINDSIDEISQLGQKIYEANNKVITHDLDSMAKKAFQLDIFLKKYTQKLIAQSKGLFVQKLLLAYLEPDWDTYKTTSNAKKYRSRKEFLHEHFFDNISFLDSTLLNSEVFYVLCTDYLTKYVDPESDSAYTRAVDFILQQITPGTPVYTYVLNLLINTYVDTEWEETFAHLVEAYLLKNHTPQPGWETSLAKRAATIKKLQPGNRAPDFTISNSYGQPFNLYGIRSKVILLFFWSSTCPHCEQVMPQIFEIYNKYHALGLEIVAVSVDIDKASWLEAIKKSKMTWVNVSDLKGMVSPVVENYCAFSTPNFFLLDVSKTIIAHPYSPMQMQESLEKAFAD